jgi:hypothetical protein
LAETLGGKAVFRTTDSDILYRMIEYFA